MTTDAEYRLQLPPGMTIEQARYLLNSHGISVNQPDSRPATWRHIERVGQYMDAFIVELLRRRRVHDQSKLVSPEVEAFDEATPTLKTLTFGTPEYEAEKRKLGQALAHHYANNSHHPSHFPNGVRGMDLWDIVEMFCDCKAASERHNDGNIRKSMEIMQRDHGISDDLKQILVNTFSLFTRADAAMGRP